jgi:hypothetical protein
MPDARQPHRPPARLHTKPPALPEHRREPSTWLPPIKQPERTPSNDPRQLGLGLALPRDAAEAAR